MTEETPARAAPSPAGGGPPGAMPLPQRESRLLRRAIALGAAAALVGFAGFGVRPGLSVLAGAAVSAANMHFLRRLARSFTASLSARAALRAAAFTGARYILLGAVLFAIIGVWNADPIGVVCGLGAPLLAILPEVGTEGFGAFRAAPPTRRPPPTSPSGAAPSGPLPSKPHPSESPPSESPPESEVRPSPQR